MAPLAATKKRRQFAPETFLSIINGGRKILTFLKKQTIFVQGDPSDAVLYIQKGKVKLTVVSESGKEATIGVLKREVLRGRVSYRATSPHVFRNRNDRLLCDAS